MTRSLLAGVMIICAFSCGPSSAQSLTEHGAATCQQWMAMHQAPNAPDTVALDNWVFGYLDGFARNVDGNYAIKGLPPADILRGLDRPSIIALMGQFCRPNPLRTVDEALTRLSAQMVAANRRLVRSSSR